MPCVAALLRSPPLVLLYDLPLLLLSAAALPIFRRCRLISFCRNANLFDSAYRGERSNAAPVGTCKSDKIQSRRKLRKAADTQAKRQRMQEATQIVLQQHLAGTRLRSACSPSSARLPMRGSRGVPSPFSGGFKGGILFGKRIPPLSRSSAKGRCHPPARRAKAPLANARRTKKEPPFQAALFKSLFLIR